MATFWEIQEEIENILTVPEDELDAEQKALLDLYLEQLGQQEADKVDAFGQFIKLQAAQAETVMEESRRLAAKAKAQMNSIARLKQRYLDIMRHHNLSKVKGNIYSLGIRTSDVVQASEDEEFAKKIYEENPLLVKRTETFKLDKNAIKDALKAGVNIEGCSLEKSYSLIIR